MAVQIFHPGPRQLIRIGKLSNGFLLNCVQPKYFQIPWIDWPWFSWRQRFFCQVGGEFIDGLDTFFVHIVQRALDRLCLQHFYLTPSSQAGPERVPVPDAYFVITKLDLDDESLDHDPGRLDVLPAECVGHLLPPGISGHQVE